MTLERFTDEARKTLTLAEEEARRFNHGYVGTEHLLLGLLRQNGTAAQRVLKGLGVEVRRVREQVVRIVGFGDDIEARDAPRHTPRVKKVVELALCEALTLGHQDVGTEHLLLGLARENEGVATLILRDQFDADAEKVREAVLAEPGNPTEDCPPESKTLREAFEESAPPTPADRAAETADRLRVAGGGEWDVDMGEPSIAQVAAVGLAGLIDLALSLLDPDE